MMKSTIHICALLLATAATNLTAGQLEVIPYNYGSVGAQERKQTYQSIYKNLSPADKAKLNKLNAKYETLIAAERRKNTPKASAVYIEELKRQHLIEIFESLTPEAVNSILKTKKALDAN